MLFHWDYQNHDSYCQLGGYGGMQHCIQLFADFGKAGFPKWGISGAAIGSSLAELVGLLFMIVYMWRHVDKKQYGLRAVFDIKLSLHLLDISVWTMVRSFFCIAPWFLFL